jgi:hypothetical protein
MKEKSKMSKQTTSRDLSSVISSVESQCGATPCGSPAGPTTDLFGREVAPAPASPSRAKARGLMTLATSGRIGIDSCASAALQRSLENRLMERLDTAGSTLFSLTWKRKTTPLGRRYLERAASGRRTGDKDCTSWPTPAAQEDNKSVEAHLAMKKRMGERDGTGANRTAITSLQVSAKLAAWPSPQAGTPKQKGYNEAGNTDNGRKTQWLASWATPAACSPNSLRGRGQDPEKRRKGNHNVNLQDQVTLTVSGPTPNGSGAVTGSIGQLNPAHSRWLMGLPSVWDDCAATATPSARPPRKRS